jgi:hypothetical protein
MLPNRPRLLSWRPESLSTAAAGITAAARSVVDSVSYIDNACQRMPEMRAWSGKSHEAAAAMFNRAHRETSKFSDYANAVAAAFQKGSGTIGSVRNTLLNKADEIDAGPMHVSDNWVVLIDQATMSAERAAELQKQAEAEQVTVNQMLLEVGDADDDIAAAVQSAAKDFGFVTPDGNLLGGLPPPPGNEVVNPRWPDGLIQQDIERQQDMAMSVREQTVVHTSDGQIVTTLTMQDGSKHVIREWGHLAPAASDSYYDRNGKLISHTFSQTNPMNGVKTTEIEWGDGTILTMTQTPDGKVSGGVKMPDGRHGILPDEFFTHPELTTVQGGLTLLDKQAASGRGIPMLTAEAVEKAGTIGRYGGPALGVGTALFDVVTADTLADACVATWSGAASIAGGEANAAASAAVATAMGFPEAVPWVYTGGAVLGGWTFGYLGGIVGNVVCR